MATDERVGALAFVGVGLLIARKRGGRRAGSEPPSPRLPARYWPAWALIALVVAIEFAVVFWVAALVRTRASVALEEAAFVLSAFVLGIVLGRAGLSLQAIARREPIGLIRGGLILLAFGAVAAWLSPSLPISVVALVAGGAGLGILFPLSASSAITLAPGQAHVASARVVLAIGVGMFTGPLLLGVVADELGLLTAWILVPLACVVALGLSFLVKRLLGAVG